MNRGDIHFVDTREPFDEVLLQMHLTIDDFMDVYLAKLRANMEEQGVIDLIPWDEAVEAFMLSLDKASGSHRVLYPNSVMVYKQIMGQFDTYISNHCGNRMDLEGILPLIVPFIHDIRKSKNLSDRTVNKYVSVIHRLGYFLYDYYPVKLPMLPPFRKVTKSLPQSLNSLEISQLLDAACRAQYPIRYHFLVSFLLASGLRRNEFRLAKVSDLNLDERYIHVRHAKGGEPRTVPLPRAIIDEAREYLDIHNLSKPDYYLFGHRLQPWNPLDNATLDYEFGRLIRSVESYRKGDPIKGFHLHSLRHTYARFLTSNRVNLVCVGQLLGHKSAESTAIYTALDTESLRAVASDALDHIGKVIRGEALAYAP